MKHKFKIIIALIIVLGYTQMGALYALAPQAISYQAVARDASGNILVNQLISLRFSIRQASTTGTIVYQETQNSTTNSLGLFSVNIGQGTPTISTLSAVNWPLGIKFLQVELDALGGTNYINMGASQLMSVPFALHAVTSNDNKWIATGNHISNENTGDVGIGISSPKAKLHIAGATLTEGNQNTHTQGAYLEWNKNSNDGKSYLLNQKGSGAGGLVIGEVDSANGITERISILNDGNVGIGISLPTAKLEVLGTTKTTNFRMTNGAGANKILTSNASGDAAWSNTSSLPGTIAYIQSADGIVGTITDGPFKFIGSTLTVSITTGQKVEVTASVALGSITAGGATMQQLNIGYKNTLSTNVSHNSDYIGMYRVVQNQRDIVTLTTVFTGLATGTYEFGMGYDCALSETTKWNNNDWSRVTVKVIN